MYFYKAYNLIIASDFKLDGLIECPQQPHDVIVHKSQIDPDFMKRIGNCPWYFSPEEQYLDFTIVAKFHIRNASEVFVEMYDCPEELVIYPLMGMVMGLILQLRGNLVMHANAVEVDGLAVGFMGDKGAGKSTTSAAFISNGFKLITDDVMPINFEDGFKILSGFPQMKVTDDLLANIDLGFGELLPRIIYPGLEKQQLGLGTHFAAESLDLGRTYVLERGETAQIIDYSVKDGFEAMMRFSYYYQRDALGGGFSADVMKKSVEIAKNGLVKKLIVPAYIGRIQETIELVREDIGR